MDKLLKNLKSLKNIAPDSEYAKRARLLVLSARSEMPSRPVFSWRPVLAFASLAVIILLSAILYFGRGETKIARNEGGLRLGETGYQQKFDISKFSLRLQERIKSFFQ